MTPSIPLPGGSPEVVEARRAARASSSSGESSGSSAIREPGPVPVGDTGGTPRELPKDDPFTKKENLQAKSLSRMYRVMALVISPINNAVANQIMENADEAAVAWVELARHDNRVKSAINYMSSAGIWGDVLGVHIEMLAPAIALPILQRTGMSMPVTQNVQPVEHWAEPEPNMSAEGLAAELAMEMMRGQAPNGSGGPTDTVTVSDPPEYNPDIPPMPPIGTAEHLQWVRQYGSFDPDSYAFPADFRPPNQN